MSNLNNLKEGKYIFHISWFPDVKYSLTKGITINADSGREALDKWENIEEFKELKKNGFEIPEFDYIRNKSL
jgi:hypothetical protein